MRLYFIRHGETDFNKTGRIQGKLDINMNLVGFKQARLLSKRLADVPFDYAFTSPLERAISTGEEILRERDIVMYKMEALTDTDVGEWQGKSRAYITRRYKILGEDLGRLLKERGGETFEDTYYRLVEFIEEVEVLEAANILVVTHASIIFSAIKLALNYPVERRLPMICQNCSITIIEKDQHGKWLVRSVNDVAHLEDF